MEREEKGVRSTKEGKKDREKREVEENRWKRKEQTLSSRTF